MPSFLSDEGYMEGAIDLIRRILRPMTPVQKRAWIRENLPTLARIEETYEWLAQ